MNTLIIGMTIGLIGKVILGVAVIRVHMHIATERKVDDDVIRAIEREKYITAAAIFFMIAGYFLETAYFMGFFA
ncbi:MAG: hypothetical protein NUV49_03425 [Patescibacteria group bacterium]|nr:hypothetical protein [Patescibacteria group bacterium]